MIGQILKIVKHGLFILVISAQPTAWATTSFKDLSTKLQSQIKTLKPKEVAEELLKNINEINTTMPSMNRNIQSKLYFLKGQSYTVLKMFDEGVKAFDQSIKHDPLNLDSYSNIGYILNQQGKYKQAIKISDWLLKKNNCFINAILNKGYSLLGMLRYKEAIEQFEQVRQLDSNNITAYMGYAKGYAGLKEHDRAIEIYDGVIKFISKTPSGKPLGNSLSDIVPFSDLSPNNSQLYQTASDESAADESGQLKILSLLRQEQITLKNNKKK